MVLTSDAPLGLTNCSSLETEYTRIVTHPDITKKSDKPIRNEPKPLMGYELNVTTADLLNQCRQQRTRSEYTLAPSLGNSLCFDINT